ncbi:MAG TPA: GAF domain-containing protein [Halanaerobiales bacterium]|nr:GAF domain-containing protein [Halanaerobiales bacterium]
MDIKEDQLRKKNLQGLNRELRALINGERDWLANLANAAALLYNRLEMLNWAGFYLLKGDELVLGPFQGLPACIRIPLGKGVCGDAASKRQTIVVADVQQYPGHIACDQASSSEIVIPMFKGEHILGVMDIDSPIRERFGRLEAQYLERFVEILVEGSDFA